MSARAQGDGARICSEKSCSTCSAACGGSGARGMAQARAKPRLLVCSSRFLLGQFVLLNSGGWPGSKGLEY